MLKFPYILIKWDLLSTFPNWSTSTYSLGFWNMHPTIRKFWRFPDCFCWMKILTIANTAENYTSWKQLPFFLVKFFSSSSRRFPLHCSTWAAQIRNDFQLSCRVNHHNHSNLLSVWLDKMLSSYYLLFSTHYTL